MSRLLIERLVFGLLAGLSSIAAVMLVNFWWGWLSTPVVPHATYDGEPPAENQGSIGEIARASNVRTVQIWSKDGSVASIEVQGRVKDDAPWVTCFTVVNPSATGEFWMLPSKAAAEFRVITTAYVTGEIHAEFGLLWDKS